MNLHLTNYYMVKVNIFKQITIDLNYVYIVNSIVLLKNPIKPWLVCFPDIKYTNAFSPLMHL